MMPNPKINVLILNWNGRNILSECVSSVLRSDYNNFSITIIDNGSTDDSLKTINDNKLIEYLKIGKNLGFSKGYNYAFDKLKNNEDDYYLILNNDTIVYESTITELSKSINKYGKNNVFCPKILNYYNKKNWYCGARINIFTGLPYHLGINKSYSNVKYKNFKTEILSGCCMLIKKSVINKLHGFSEEYKMYFEDVDLSIRLKKSGYNIYFISDSIIEHKISYSFGGRFSLRKYFYKHNSYFRFIYLNNKFLIFIIYFLVNLFFSPIYFFKFLINNISDG